MDTGAVVAVTVPGGAEGDTSTIEGTLEAVTSNLAEAKKKAGDDSGQAETPEERWRTRATTARPCCLH